MPLHSPAPWREGKFWFDIDDPDGQLLAVVMVLPGERERSQANAALMRKAPELAEKLRWMVKAFNVKDIDPLVAFATIEKARALLDELAPHLSALEGESE